MDLPLQPIAELSRLLRTREIASLELVNQTLARIERLNPSLNAYITVTAELAREQAALADAEIAAGQYRGPLHGIPYAAKDLCFTRGVPTTGGSKIFRDFVPDYDAAVVVRLRRAGAVLIGKSNLHENAYGITSSNPHFGPVRNPWDLERIPGGSSGGSAAALASGLCSFSLGTDTGGSIRIPAAFCSVTGLKPTFGRVSRYGVFPLGHTLDHVGPFAWTAVESGWIYAAMAGHDPHEDASVDRPVELPHEDEFDIKGLRIGVPENFYFEQLDPAVERSCRLALKTFESLGAVLEPIRLPDIDEMNTVARVILLAEATAVHIHNFKARPQDFGADQVALLDQGRFITAVDYLNAQRRRRELCDAFARAFEKVDIMAAPAVAVLPAKIGQKDLEIRGETHDVRLATTRNARALNLTGLPLLTMPCGFSEDGLPVGLQLIGDAFDERRILAAGAAFQLATDFHLRRPPTI